MSQATEDDPHPVAFEDHFSVQAADYARHRPRYPEALFEEISALAPAHERVWDCATGSGQAALVWAEHFDEVYATDASASQIEHAHAHPKVRYRVASAEASGLPPGSVDLVCAAAAAHWFDHEAFHREVRRVGRPKAVVALFSYSAEVQVHGSVDALTQHWVDVELAADWPERIALVRDRYRTLPFPFEEIPCGDHACSARWSAADLVGHFSTWSATQRAQARTGEDLCARFARELQEVWPAEAPVLPVRIPLFMRVGRLP